MVIIRQSSSSYLNVKNWVDYSITLHEVLQVVSSVVSQDRKELKARRASARSRLSLECQWKEALPRYVSDANTEEARASNPWDSRLSLEPEFWPTASA